MVVGKYLLATCCMMYIGLSDGLSQTDKIQVEMGTGSIYTISEKDAMKAIAKLSKRAKNEDSWMFYDGRLINIGMNESPDNTEIRFFLEKKEKYTLMELVRINNDTVKINIDNGKEIIFGHNHTDYSPAGSEDLATSACLDSLFNENSVVSRSFVKGKICEYKIEKDLAQQLQKTNYKGKREILESKMNIAYDPENEYIKNAYPYNFIHKLDKKYKQYIDIMKNTGVKIQIKRPRAFYHK